MTLDSFHSKRLNDSIPLLTNYMNREPIWNDLKSWQWLFFGVFFASHPFERCMLWTRMFDKCAMCIVSIKLIATKSRYWKSKQFLEFFNKLNHRELQTLIVSWKENMTAVIFMHYAFILNTKTRAKIPFNVSRDYPPTVIPILEPNHSNLLNQRTKYIRTRWHTKSSDHFFEWSQSALIRDRCHIDSQYSIYTKPILFWDIYFQQLFMVLHLIRAQFNQIKVAIF